MIPMGFLTIVFNWEGYLITSFHVSQWIKKNDGILL